MKIKQTIARILMIALSATLSAFTGGIAADEVKLSFDHFYDNAELTQALRSLEKAYPRFVTVQSIGKSVQGRDLWAIILNNPKTGPAEHKPGYFVDGNIHGNEIQGAEVSLYMVYYLLTSYGKTALATRLLDERVFYVVPTMNPDSREFFIHQPSNPNSPRSGWIPVDDDRDGAADEDEPEDLDGDGAVTQMRKKDPYGNYRPDPNDVRILVRIKPGEKGEYTLLGEEGIDNDGDGRINEDGPGQYDMNRNFGYNWQPNYVQRGAGPYPFSFPEAKAVADFAMAHPNIMGSQSFHNSGGLILRGPGARNMGEMNTADRQILDYVGKKGEAILPGYRYITIYKDMYTVYGGSIDFFSNTLGIYAFSNELDMDFAREPKPAPRQTAETGAEASQAREMLMSAENRDGMVYQDLVLLGEQYTQWKTYRHPLYGDIEIGGEKKFSSRVPPLFKLAETCHRNAAFVLYHADQLPRLKFDSVKVQKLKDGLFQLDVVVTNATVTPTISAVALQRKIHRVDRMALQGGAARLVAAGAITDPYRSQTRPYKILQNAFWVDSGVPSFGKLEFRLMVEGRGSIQLVYDSLKGGYYQKEVKLE